jgi:hypothetical protein
VRYSAFLLVLLLIGCSETNKYVYRIRADDAVVKRYILHYVADSSLIVEEYRPRKRGAFSVVPLRSVDTLWHRWSSVASNVRTGALIGAGVGLVGGVIVSNPSERSSMKENFRTFYDFNQSFGVTGVAMIASALGALIGGNIPSEGTVLLPDDPETLAFLREYSKLRSFDELPSDIKDTLAKKRD